MASSISSRPVIERPRCGKREALVAEYRNLLAGSQVDRGDADPAPRAVGDLGDLTLERGVVSGREVALHGTLRLRRADDGVELRFEPIVGMGRHDRGDRKRQRRKNPSKTCQRHFPDATERPLPIG
jgi:hypothetical protein